MRLTEVVNLTPAEQERLALPSFIQKILPRAQSRAQWEEVPIEPYKEEWVYLNNPRRLHRSFMFNDRRFLMLFVQEVLDYEWLVKHTGKLQIEDNVVQVEVWTKDLNDVTQIDINYANELDSINDDIKFRLRI